MISLFWATLLPALALLACGLILAGGSDSLVSQLHRFPRSFTAAIVCFGGGALWFLLHIAQLGAADFGNIRHWLLILFGTVAVLGFFFNRDFLAVRGSAVLILLTANQLLAAAYMQEPASRLFLVSFIYLMILVALYLGTVPYRLRDFFNWLLPVPQRRKLFGSLLAGYGVLLTVVAFSY